MSESLVRWPSELSPGDAPVYSFNRLEMSVPADRVWSWLVRAAFWPSWYANSWRVRIEGGGLDLSPGCRFSWITFGVPVSTRVEEWAPGGRLSWSGEGFGARGYHGWVIEAKPGGCTVTTEEVQTGLVPSLGRALLRPGLLHFHQRWLEGLARVAQTGAPPDEIGEVPR